MEVSEKITQKDEKHKYHTTRPTIHQCPREPSDSKHHTTRPTIHQCPREPSDSKRKRKSKKKENILVTK
jgi:hypothetical protein